MSGNIYHLANNFNAGELSPLIDVRSDTGKYRTGCRRMRNMIPRAVGGAFSRPGTQYLGAAKHAAKKARLIDFNFSTTTSFQIEAGDLYMRFWSNRAQVAKSSVVAWVTATAYVVGDYRTNSGTTYRCLVAHTSGTFATDLAAAKWVAQTAYEIVSPYLEADLFELQYRQINDVIYIVHPDYEPRKLSRVADDNWTLATVAWDWPATLDENAEATTITPSAVTGTGITLTASASLFTANHVGAYFQIAHRRESAFCEAHITVNNTSSTLRVVGAWEVATSGTWAATIHVDRSEDNGTTWQTIRTYKGLSDRNVAPTRTTEPKEVLLRVRVADWTSCTGVPRAWIEAADSKVYGLAKVTAYTSATVVTADVVKDIANTSATLLWSEGAWSAHQGYPRSVAFHEQRIVYGGTSREPVRVWGSAIGDFDTFRKGTADDDSFDYVMASTQSSQIQWMCANSSGLIIGTGAEEWLLHSGSDTSPITPTNVRVVRQSSEGSEFIAARLVKNVVLFVQRYGRTVSEMAYSFEEDSMRANDLTLLSEHVTEGGIVQLAYQARKDAVLWAVTGNGKLIGLTYQREHEVAAWHVHDTDGEFESVSCNYASTGSADEVWFIVKRTINGSTVRYIESFDLKMAALNFDDPDRLVNADCAKTYDGAAATSITGLSHLEGEEVAIKADGGTLPRDTVASGALTLDVAASVVVVGLPFIPLIQPMKLEMQVDNGTTRGRRFRPSKVVLSVYKSLGAEINHDPDSADTWSEIPFRDSTDILDEPPPLVTDDLEWDVAAPYGRSVNVAIRQIDPQPLNLLAMTTIFSVDG